MKQEKDIYLFDTFENENVILKTAEQKTIKWYTCGPTVYADSHVGHARNYIVCDTIRNILERYFNYSMIYVMNITDIDDKIIKKAQEEWLKKRFVQDGATISPEEYKKTFIIYAESSKLFTEKELNLIEEIFSNAEKMVEVIKNKIKIEKKVEHLVVYENMIKSIQTKEERSIQTDVLLPYLKSIYSFEQIENETFQEYADKWKEAFFDDMDSLGIRKPDVVPCVSEYVPQIVGCIERIMANGFGYVSNGSVYFDTAAFKQKGREIRKLGKWCVNDDKEETVEKKNSVDFVLWKASKSGEPFWESPWGKGRPGWHIECTAMSIDILGEGMDIHSGGIDLIFPHHNNEIVQAEACLLCEKWTTHFFHVGHVHIKGQKMSKSLKNFISIKEALKEYTKNELRLFFLKHKWNSPMSWVKEALDDATKTTKLFQNFFENIKAIKSKSMKHGEKERKLLGSVLKAQKDVDCFLRFSFDTPSVITALLDLISIFNSYLSEEKQPSVLLLSKAKDFISATLSLMGVEFKQAGLENGEDALKYIRPCSRFRDRVRELAKKEKTTC